MAKERQLLFSTTIKDCEIQTYKGTGNGGQHRNTTESCVRVIHRPSGAVGQACDERKQSQNKVLAFQRMANSKEFRIWNKMEASRLMGVKSPEQVVDEMMDDKNLKVEVKDERGRWIEQKAQ